MSTAVREQKRGKKPLERRGEQGRAVPSSFALPFFCFPPLERKSERLRESDALLAFLLSLPSLSTRCAQFSSSANSALSLARLRLLYREHASARGGGRKRASERAAARGHLSPSPPLTRSRRRRIHSRPLLSSSPWLSARTQRQQQQQPWRTASAESLTFMTVSYRKRAREKRIAAAIDFFSSSLPPPLNHLHLDL